MSHEVARYFIVSFPGIFFPLLATFIILNKEIKKSLVKLLFTSLLISLVTLVSFDFIEVAVLKEFINFAIGTVIFRIFFRTKWLHAVGILFLFYFITSIPTIIASLISLYWFNVSIDQMIDNEFIWLTVFLPSYVFSIVLAYIMLIFRRFLHPLFSKITITFKFAYFRPLILPLIIQLALIMSFLTQFFLDISRKRNMNMVIITTLTLLFLNVYILFKSISITEKRIITQNQDTISENVMGLIDSVRSQRHDFINHLQIITSLHYSESKDELSNYLSKINGEVSFYNDLLKIDQPIIGALLNAKIAQAEMKGIKIDIDIRATLSKMTTNSYDIARILGNLIDNAIDAIKGNNQEDRWIKFTIKENGPLLSFTITNPGVFTDEIKENLFLPGYTTKENNHSGLGLYICQQLAKKLHGNIETYCFDNIVTFSLALPRR